MLIRDEDPADVPAISDVVEHAFGQPSEARLVERLRADGDAAISLVAVVDGAVAGHVLLSPMSAPFRALGLAPVSVSPAYQRTGIGRALIDAAIDRARVEEWDAIFVLGDPAYYGRFGFRADLATGFASPYAGPYLMVLPLAAALPVAEGVIDYAPAFSAMEQDGH
ncbi:GNAT family N-acetyltransferase [Sphingomonas colocasiae]|uniref:N-acetyltransferase n=1 Tax=Sphingomonas colocasiae TaxID=1848973 RepID=A0ABS7PKQ2_9SPHN|nr:N-acetyltransferase [Sphingomonas colocasiae]MBY8821569.1 N-acetyltransferase [Sphingomonas colocasiae]